MNDLLRLVARPARFEPGEPFWDDPVIAGTLLATHLDPEVDLASRRPGTLDATVAHLAGRGLLGPGTRVLDLGCGPGLLAGRMAAAGAAATGVDISGGSLEHARRAAAEAGLEIRYLLRDFRELDFDGEFDLVIQSFGELSTLDDATRDGLLAAARRALVPGGRLVFDVTTPAAHPPQPPGWELAHGGLWRPDEHLVLTAQHRFGDDLLCEQFVVVAADGARVYRMWFQDYTPERLTAVLAAAGFRVEELWGSLTGEPCAPGDEWLAVLGVPSGT